MTDAAEPTTSQEPIVVINSVSKVFRNDEGEQKAALDNVSLTIKRGGIYGIIGLSGAGKSTLIRLINGIESATSGTVTVDGLEIGDLSGRELRELRTQIGIYFVAPLLVAGCHSACAISLLYKNLLSLWGAGAVTGTLTIGIALVVTVYAIYLASTYLVARSAVISGAGKKLLA